MTHGQLLTIAHALHDCLCEQTTPLGEAMGIAEQFTDLLQAHCDLPDGFDAHAFKAIICKNDGASLERHSPEDIKAAYDPWEAFELRAIGEGLDRL